ncbi:uncharacterized protein N7515_009462 [Penicillium bovifimosum]|uniref:SRP9 domain-containing protein n=1 Tax=Penicillium bovifimosum TaxID=126998 RepID=A0A9W9GJN7_9EURO|nr:uncharacterized protein N7515_009462 [Penicillium bovifimosum]KAJ5121501.1 hypothetical protein N7515_009462 [Penicillium bovifimosum]
MPYLPTSQAYLEQSAQLLQAYPDTTRIVTKYNFPSTRPANQKRIQKSQKNPKAGDASTPTVPIASLTLKTFNPTTGICLHYRTNKAQEVSRLITSLGKLAAGADVAGLGLSSGTGDVEMVDAPVTAPAAGTEEVGGKGQGQQQGQGKKKKGGKGKR